MLNAEYNPDWEAVHDFHDGERTRLENEITKWIKQATPESESSALKKLEDKRDYHHQTCLRCLDTYQHKTVKDYVDWALENYGALPEILKKDYAAHIDLDRCQTIDQARAVISQLHELEAKNEFLNEETGAQPCPVGMPDGLDIFTRTGSNTLTTKWMNFKARCNFGVGDECEFILLTSVDTRENEKHVCFFGDGDPTRHAQMMITLISQLAFQFVEQDLGKDFGEFSKGHIRSNNGFFASLLSKKPKDFPTYHFYTHTFMSMGLPREDFMRHELQYDEESGYHQTGRHSRSFRRIKMHPFDCMPQYLKVMVDQYIGFDGICLQE